MHRMHEGFTLIELIVTVTIVAILIVVGVPSLKSFYDSYRGNSAISRIQQALSLARNQAISYGISVHVCANAMNQCGTDWSKGILIRNSNNNKILQVISGFNSNDNVKGESVIFRSDGLATSDALFIYCPNGETYASKSIKVSHSGVIREAGNNVSCH